MTNYIAFIDNNIVLLMYEYIDDIDFLKFILTCTTFEYF